ncbi:MAG: PKD domain-containing protein, partial [Acidimicrobiales bacterium]
ATNGVWSHDFVLGPGDLATPVGVTVLIDGQVVCGLLCLITYWDPDLEARLFDPTGTEIDRSTCPDDAQGHCGSLLYAQGQQETIDVMPTVAGTYRLEIWPVSNGGTFTYDISAGVGSAPPPSGTPPTAEAGAAQTIVDDGDGFESVTLDGSSSSDDGAIVSYSWSEGGVEIATGATPVVQLSVGSHTITLAVIDDEGLSASDTVIIDVSPAPPPNVAPTADAGPDQAVPDTRKKGSERVRLDGSGSTDADGSISTWTWSIGGTTIATGANPQVTLDVGINMIDLAVTDDDGATATDSVQIAVGVSAPADDPPVADAGPDQPNVVDADLSGGEPVILDGSGSTDDNGIASYSWREDDVELASGVNPTVDLELGTHTITLVVTDSAGNTDSDVVVVTVEGLLGTFDMHIHDLDVTSEQVGRNKWMAIVDVFVVGSDLEFGEIPIVLGADPATVTFALSSGGTISCSTQAGNGLDGKCTAVTSALSKGVKSLTLTVVSVTAPGFAYVPAQNHDADGDSDGTSITISRP